MSLLLQQIIDTFNIKDEVLNKKSKHLEMCKYPMFFQHLSEVFNI